MDEPDDGERNYQPGIFGFSADLHLIYQLDEFGIFLVSVFTLRQSRFEEKHGQILKLLGGMLKLTLAVVMWIDPGLMNDLSSALVVFGIVFGLTGLILVLHRLVLPRINEILGSQDRPS